MSRKSRQHPSPTKQSGRSLSRAAACRACRHRDKPAAKTPNKNKMDSQPPSCSTECSSDSSSVGKEGLREGEGSPSPGNPSQHSVERLEQGRQNVPGARARSAGEECGASNVLPSAPRANSANGNPAPERKSMEEPKVSMAQQQANNGGQGQGVNVISDSGGGDVQSTAQQAQVGTASNNFFSANQGGCGDPHAHHHQQHHSHPHHHRTRGIGNRQRGGSPSSSGSSMHSDQSHRDVRLEDINVGVSNSSEKRQRSLHCNRHATNNTVQQLASHPSIVHALTHGQGNLNNQGAPYNWQSSRTTVKERLQYMFNNEVMADVHFMVGKGPQVQRIPAHKFVLSISSAVFDAMFNGGMATSCEEIDIPDVEPSAFLALLRFLYTDEVQIGPETVMTTLYTAKKYAVPALERACVEFLKRNLCSENAFMLLTQARLFDEPQLAALCLETIDKNTSEALNAEGFTEIDLDTLCVVLERDTLGIRECKLFCAVCRWAGAETQRQNLPVTPENQRAVLGRALSLIRFPLMTVEEFAVGAAQSGILTDREVVELFLHFTVNPKPSVNFLDTPRCCLTGKEQVVARFCQIESRWGYSGTSDRIR